MPTSCNGHSDHHYFVPDVAIIPSEGKVVVIALCTSCGNPLFIEKVVAQPDATMTLKSIQKEKKEV